MATTTSHTIIRYSVYGTAITCMATTTQPLGVIACLLLIGLEIHRGREDKDEKAEIRREIEAIKEARRSRIRTAWKRVKARTGAPFSNSQN